MCSSDLKQNSTSNVVHLVFVLRCKLHGFEYFGHHSYDIHQQTSIRILDKTFSLKSHLAFHVGQLEDEPHFVKVFVII